MFLRRIMGPIGKFRSISTVLIGFIIARTTAALLVNIFQCWPVSHYYKPYEPGHCIHGQNAFFETMGSLSLIEDVCILCLPMPWVWRLQVDLRKKIAIIGIFSMGGL